MIASCIRFYTEDLCVDGHDKFSRRVKAQPCCGSPNIKMCAKFTLKLKKVCVVTCNLCLLDFPFTSNGRFRHCQFDMGMGKLRLHFKLVTYYFQKVAEPVQHLDPCQMHNISAWVWASPSYNVANFSPRVCPPLWNLVINFHECTRWLYVESHPSLSRLLLFLASTSSTCLSPFVYWRMLWLIFMPLHFFSRCR